jgi:hypothetical protein
MSGTNYSVLRHDVQLAGGVTRKNIYLQIKAFFNSAKSLVLETAEATGNAH